MVSGRSKLLDRGNRAQLHAWLTFSLFHHRLLHSLMNAKKIIINAAHYLVLADKEAYHYDMAMPFLGTVSSLISLFLYAWRNVSKGVGTHLGHALSPSSFQDETRLNQDSLPEKMVIKLDATPRWEKGGEVLPARESGVQQQSGLNSAAGGARERAC